MGVINLYIVKALKRLRLIKYFNFHLSKTINGVKIIIPFVNGMGITNYVNEHDWLDALIKQFLKNNDSAFIDVGVNIGQTAIRVKTLKPEIGYIGFEPNSACAMYTKELIKANRFRECSVVCCALSSGNKLLVLEKTMLDDLRASIVPTLRPGFFKHQEKIVTIDYDSFYINQSISFVKIDVEVAELEVIAGMQKSINRHQPVIVCEVLDSHDHSVFESTQSRAQELSRLLFSLKYSIIQLETSREKHKVVSFRKTDKIQIKQWTSKSLDLNDYIFYPASRENEVLEKLFKSV